METDVMKLEIFELKKEHIELLRATDIGWSNTEFGAPYIDPKRPYGNSNVIGDIAMILDIDLPDYESDEYEELAAELSDLHYGTMHALQIAIDTGELKLGTYHRTWATRWTYAGK